jgi:C4-dicarboxylate-specific signal transduction histidine kinase
MAASLAHEIKQPIGAAITSANTCIEWLAHEPPNLDRARAAAARIDKYGNRAAEIIDRIRSLYKKSPPQRELVDVNEIIQEMLTLLKGEANRFSVAMRTELTADLPKMTVDRVQLQQVFMNLVLNAIEAMKDSGGELAVKSELQDGQLQFSVSDTGVGLPTEKTRSFLRSLPPSRRAAAWGWPSAVRLWNRMAACCGRLPTMGEEQHFTSPCRRR